MCGRFELDAGRREVEQAFDARIEDDFPARYNIAPTQPILVIKAPEAFREATSNMPRHDALLVRWGFIPAWTKQPDQWPLTFNIRAETVAIKRSFKNALRHHRVIIPATGFYEWKKRTDGKSQSYYIGLSDKTIIGFAGLMETWSGKEGSQVDTAAIITCAAKAPLKSIHHRMPVIVQKKDVERWLDCRNFRPDEVIDIARDPVIGEFDVFPVSGKINNTAYLGSDVKEKIDLCRPTESDNEKKVKNLQNKSQLDLF